MASPDPISVFYSKLGRYPGNNKQWWIARAEVDDPDASPAVKAGDFLPEILDKLFAGSMRAPRGHFVLDAFNKDRSYVSGIADLTAETTKERPTGVAFYAGRVWYGCKSTVYFSQVLTHKHKVGLCYQEADPTSEVISDPIATDGGVIPIPEAHRINKLLPNGTGLLVFAENGVWHITGTQAGFSAKDYEVNKVSAVGCISPLSIVEAEGTVFFWSATGIIGMQQANSAYGPIPGKFDRTNISEQTVQSFYNEIPDNIKEEAKGIYDPKANVVSWLYRDSDVAAHQYNRVIKFDISLTAFYPWKFENLASASPVIKGHFLSNRENAVDIPTDISPSQVEYITMKDDKVRIAQPINSSFVDWETENGTGIGYDSYVEAGYELFNDAMRNKSITYIFTYFKRTEESFDAGELDNPSSCFLTVKWDWASGSHSNKWTSPVQVYRPGRILFDNPDTGFGMVITKNKVRGNGKAIQFRLGTSEPGRNFDLQGWSIAITGNTVP